MPDDRGLAQPRFPSPPPGDPDALVRLARTFASAAAAVEAQQAALRAELRASDGYAAGRRPARLRADLAAAGGQLAVVNSSLRQAAELVTAAAEELRGSQAEVAALEGEARRVGSAVPVTAEGRARVQRLARVAEEAVEDQRVRALRVTARLQQLATAGLPGTASGPAAVAALARSAGVGPPLPAAPRGLTLLRSLWSEPALTSVRPNRRRGGAAGGAVGGVRVELGTFLRGLAAQPSPPARPVTLVAAVLGQTPVPRRAALFRALRRAVRAGLATSAPAAASASPVSILLPPRLLADAVGAGDE